MINIIVQGPEGSPLRNPIWEIGADADYAFVDLLREVCKAQGVDPTKYKVRHEGQDMQGGALCLNFLSRGDAVEVVER